MNYIELFAGCGGLSLGLESEGFELFFANELSPMAGETFAYNHLGIDLNINELNPNDRVYWISSKHKRNELEARLKENPQIASGLENRICDVNEAVLSNKSALEKSLLIGSIIDLNILLKKPALKKIITNGLDGKGVDLISGGPPCQSFSMAGMRQHSNQRNMLPWAFAEFVSSIKPKIALLENVTGILRPFNIDGEKYYAWYEVAKAFAVEGYIPICLHINAKYVGTAQNRPRFVMIAIRKDVFSQIKRNSHDDVLSSIFLNSECFYKKAKKHGALLEYGYLNYYDIEQNSDLFKTKLFNPLATYYPNELIDAKFITAKDAIDDLNSNSIDQSHYVKKINSLAFKDTPAYEFRKLEWCDTLAINNKPSNNEHRGNSDKVRARFRLYQVMDKLTSNTVRNQVKAYLKSGDESVISIDSIKALSRGGWLLNVEGKKYKRMSVDQTLDLLTNVQTKKQTQKALIADKPAPAALSIPDDACHYDDETQRTLTVREMARFQSFPDWFVFRSKVTTGGQMRRFQVPQYTQVGNAVPPLLGKALGKVCHSLLDLSDIRS